MTRTASGFIKLDLVLLTLFSALMAFLFYAGVDALSQSGSAFPTLGGKDKTPDLPLNQPQDATSVKQRLASPAKLVINPQSNPISMASLTPEQQITDLQNQVAQLNLQLQQIEPAAPTEATNSSDCPPANESNSTKTEATTPKIDSPSAQPTKPIVPPQKVSHTAETPQKTQTLHDKTWLFSQKNSHYSMQILAVRSKKELRQEIKKSGLKVDQLAYYPTVRNGHVWYALLYGMFKNQAQAQQAMQKLPKQIQQNKPWLRSLRAIKKAIQQVPIETK